MSRPSDQPNIVEAMAFTLFCKATEVPSGAHELEAWMAIWRTVDAVAKEQYREQAQQQMRAFEDQKQ